MRRQAREIFEQLNAPREEGGAGNEQLAFLERAALEARLGADEVRAAASDNSGPARQIEGQLSLVARMIRAGVGSLRAAPRGSGSLSRAVGA